MYVKPSQFNKASRGLQSARLLYNGEALSSQIAPARLLYNDAVFSNNNMNQSAYRRYEFVRANRIVHRITSTARAEARGSFAAAAFTIVELVVSIGILGILMVVAGGVFTLTLKSSGQATAIIDIHQSLRALEDSLREDLRFVQPGASIMVIQSHAINSYWTADAREVDDDANPLNQSLLRDPQRERVAANNTTLEVDRPRADMLMFFTSRPGTSFRDPQVSGTLQQVVYGHALPGEWNALTKGWSPTITPPSGFVDAYAASSFTPDQLQHMGMDYEYQVVPSVSSPPVFAIPARDWHLARRGVLIVDQDLSNPPNTFFPAPWLFDESSFFPGSEDDPKYSGLQQRAFLRDGRRDYVVNGVDPSDPSSNSNCPNTDPYDPQCPFDYAYHVVNRLKPIPEGPEFGPALDVDPINVAAVVNMMPRTLLDAAPPSNQVGRMGQYFLPHCASFKVEWALDLSDVDLAPCEEIEFNREILWVDPLKFAELISQINQMVISEPNCVDRPMRILKKLILKDPAEFVINLRKPERFVDTSGPNVIPYDAHIFYPNDPFPTGATNVVDQPDPLFPKALRITVDVYDPAGRLERPIRHVMVIPVGE